MKKLLLLTLSLFVGLGIAFAFTYEWVIDDMEYANDAAAQAAYVRSTTKATGGTITYDGDYVIHTFLSDGTFTPNSAFNVEYLIVAGGGGGGNAGNGGGGGAGGLLANGAYDKSITAQAYTIVVGDGGAVDVQGGASSALGISATGGGYGGKSSSTDGGAGGSGGGGGYTTDGGSGIVGQGYDGGDIVSAGNPNYGAAGGGGASEDGSNGAGTYGGDGGDGVSNDITGSAVYYAGGGGGGCNEIPDGAGGLGGGGDAGDAGTANTGGGGGGFGNLSGDADAGGSGIVIIRYLGGFNLQSYSESTIKTQGSYSLKGVAAITDSLNDTLTKSLTGADKLDLTTSEGIEYDIYALRTGSNIKIGIHDSGGTTTEHTANVASSNTNQTESWDMSAVTDANKDDIDSIIITIMNADAANTFYLDDIKWELMQVAVGLLLIKGDI